MWRGSADYAELAMCPPRKNARGGYGAHGLPMSVATPARLIGDRQDYTGRHRDVSRETSPTDEKRVP